MKTSELRNLAPDELSGKLSSLKKELFDFRMKAAAGKLDKFHRIKECRRDVARILTILRSTQTQKT